MSASHPPSRFVFVALYAAALVVLLDQAAELVASMYPFQIGDIQWRFGAFGLIVGRTTTAVLVDVLVFMAALGLMHRSVLGAWAIVHLVAAVALVIGLVSFSLDALELRRRAVPEVAGTFDLAAGRAAVVVLVVAVYCVWAGVATILVMRGGQSKPGDNVLVVKRPH